MPLLRTGTKLSVEPWVSWARLTAHTTSPMHAGSVTQVAIDVRLSCRSKLITLQRLTLCCFRYLVTVIWTRARRFRDRTQVHPFRQPRDLSCVVPNETEPHRVIGTGSVDSGAGEHSQALGFQRLNVHPGGFLQRECISPVPKYLHRTPYAMTDKTIRRFTADILRGVPYQRPGLLLNHRLPVSSGQIYIGARATALICLPRQRHSDERPQNRRVHERHQPAAGLPTAVFCTPAEPVARRHVHRDAAPPHRNEQRRGRTPPGLARSRSQLRSIACGLPTPVNRWTAVAVR